LNPRGLRNRTVESIDTGEFNVRVSFGNGSVLTIESSASLKAGPGEAAVEALAINRNGSIAIDPALYSLAGQRVLSSVAFKSGLLRLVLDTGTHLIVPFDEHYEAWQLTGQSGREWISMPGGGLTTLPVE
jgi:hypothetical protein